MGAAKASTCTRSSATNGARRGVAGRERSEAAAAKAAARLRKELVLDLVLDVADALELEGGDVAEEHDTEARVPQHLVDEHLGEDGLGVGAGDLAVEEAVEVVRGGAVDQEAEGGQADEARPAGGAERAVV